MIRIPRALVLAAVVTFAAGTAQAEWTWTPQTGRWINAKRLPKETAELQIEHARELMMQGDYKKAWRETGKFESFYSDSPLADENHFLRGEIRLHQGQFKRAAKLFQELVVNYPDTDRYDDAIEKQYEIGDAYYEKGCKRVKQRWRLFRKRPLRHAIDVYAMVVDNQPFTPQAAQAQYKIGLSHQTRKEYVEAAYEYRRVIEDYGSSEWVDEASYGLAETYYDASHPARYDQTPSRLAIDAVDSFKNRYPDDPRAEDLGARRQEMRDRIAEQRLATARFYEKRREFDSARLYYQIILDDFSDSQWLETAQTWLAKHPEVKTDARQEIHQLRGEAQ